ncbi:MAG: hypothetical protein HOQ30_09320 [Gemmatimonadaceae bacterium]|nr:hypothetical protein [Gemmatimonadaceae bacterium]NUQ93721.1 hypothetical protein [Gemmatimonadaceae bacterium]NUR34197.1 hypothetical protein [Gemmatimonadaceae bacterium]
MIESGDERWPAEVAVLGDGGTAVFESPWLDTTRVSRFSTTSARADGARRAYRIDRQ